MPGLPPSSLPRGPAGFLNPGRAEFGYGASVLIRSDETSKGANVMQKGFSIGDSQFKLQVDGVAGRPSCVIVGTGSPTIFVALASRSVADGRWHRIACSRGNALLTVAVDGAEVGRTAIPSSLSIVNDDPLSIGGKGTSANNDQFVGVIDDVYVTRIA
ncbi:LamG-like jellyroll fold domain-containing protein [Dactylosporangium sp. NPDC048998]|uniref:LamG-like jellyroll fold domain-containing protein n=1 Tax=Dactylosporangium sp. NPDC048998 TaxID=3363976 RepID=UPI00371C582D